MRQNTLPETAPERTSTASIAGLSRRSVRGSITIECGPTRSRGDLMVLREATLDILRCPACQAPIHADGVRREADDLVEGELVCGSGAHRYPVHERVPSIMPQSLMSDEDWRLWREHLDGFSARRTERVSAPRGVLARLTRTKGEKAAFAAYLGRIDGRLLDIGCGPGALRLHVPDAVSYIGVDPLPLPETGEFEYVQAIAEQLPFADDTFRHVVVISALDHMKDIQQFAREVRRVLAPGGRLHISNTIHDRKQVVRYVAHAFKDWVEDRQMKGSHAPHHMHEFDQEAFLTRLEPWFSAERHEPFSASFYTPMRVFATFAPSTVPVPADR